MYYSTLKIPANRKSENGKLKKSTEREKLNARTYRTHVEEADGRDLSRRIGFEMDEKPVVSAAVGPWWMVVESFEALWPIRTGTSFIDSIDRRIYADLDFQYKRKGRKREEMIIIGGR